MTINDNIIFMDKLPKIIPPSPQLNPASEGAGHEQALDFVESHRDYLDHYARGRVNFQPAPPELDTFAFDLKENIVYINDRFYRRLGFSDEETLFATCHELEHLTEKAEMLTERGGERKFTSYVKKIEDSRAYGLLDNCVADIRQNRAVVARTPGFADLEISLYREDLFPETDFTGEPRHIQFAQALLREARVPGEICQVDPEVRVKLDQVKSVVKGGLPLLAAMTHPATPMSTRVRLQDKYLWPICQELLEKDKEDKKKNKGEGEGDPNEMFKDAYERAEKKVLSSVPIRDIKKALEEWQATPKENPLDVADREYAEKLGVQTEDIRRYRDIVKSLEKAINTETGETLIDELHQIFRRIISRRIKPAMKPRYPTEEGEDLIHPGELVASFKGGNLEPKVWETMEVREKPGLKFGEVEITLVCDRSASMLGAKAIEQNKAAVLAMEALKRFSDDLENERVNMESPLEVRSEIYAFQATGEDRIPLKQMSKELEEGERVKVAKTLSTTPGLDTTDYATLEAIHAGVGPETREKIKEGILKKIVIVFTDGVSGNAVEVKRNSKLLREKGVIVIGVGITAEGAPAVETYAPEARLAETAEKLPFVLADLLKEHLADI
ncbi:hypothetical protein A3G06_01265 [Candidatus Nomurabacteria bacterium RIFCSPLOWO2_12_FULL_46_14]|uniref:VWFA domain-containing protein n=1 Tax=Candidatus Nomurabacteria bacterium RIFCSPLOWO2_12_FULL_46_14 TaxID=1801797 RepID=A0A1F6Y823_9BACT|nr:MAG: hypothetical protein A3G06_01265 [Candidatus Nomurabacteria bacterium RIFCSPLOWO2_12_FULL_46_14]